MGMDELIALDTAGRMASGRKASAQELAGVIDQNTWVLQEVLKRLDKLPDGLRQSLADHLWADQASTTFDRQFLLSATQITLGPPQTAMPRRVTAFLTYCNTQTGFVTLGRDIIPVPAGSFFLNDVAIPLEFGDVATLNVGTPGGSTGSAGEMFLGLWSQIQPRWGEIT